MPSRFNRSFEKALHASAVVYGTSTSGRCESHCPSVPHYSTTPTVGRCEKKDGHRSKHITKYHGRWLSWSNPTDEGPVK